MFFSLISFTDFDNLVLTSLSKTDIHFANSDKGWKVLTVMDNDIMTLKEVAEYLKLSELSLYRLLRARKIPAFKIGQQWRFKKTALDKWIDEKMNETQNYKKALHK